jgi:hypothetical protein
VPCFFQYVHNRVKVFWLDPFVPEVAFSLLPLLEEIEISAPPISRSTKSPEEEYQHSAAAATGLAGFGPFIYECERTNRPVNGSHSILKWQDLIEEKCECVSKAMVH